MKKADKFEICRRFPGRDWETLHTFYDQDSAEDEVKRYKRFGWAQGEEIVVFKTTSVPVLSMVATVYIETKKL